MKKIFPVIFVIVFISLALIYPKQAAVLGQKLQNWRLANQKVASLVKSQPTPPLADVSPTPTIQAIKATSTPTIAKPSPTPIKSTPTPEPIINNTPPNAGYSRQQVSTDQGNFSVDIISADLNSTRVIVDTASPSDCRNDCPVTNLADYASRNGAFAGINGSFFCPKEYPSCSGKTNSFDTLLMNKNKVYFNSANNVYSVVPAVIFSGNSARFIGQSLEWGRDTGVDAVIANYPLLTFNGQIAFSSSSESKFNVKGARDFIGANGNTVYIGVIRNATMAEGAKVLQAMGIPNALNLDEGGSTALWYNGSYIAGPGRGIPNAVLFVRK